MASESEELRKEKQRIEAENRIRGRVFRVVEEEKMVAPFPVLIKVQKNERKAILDLMEAIHQVKVSVKFFSFPYFILFFFLFGF